MDDWLLEETGGNEKAEPRSRFGDGDVVQFSQGTVEAAFAGGAAPITIIGGDKLIEPRLDCGIGLRERALEVLAVYPDVFVDLGEA